MKRFLRDGFTGMALVSAGFAFGFAGAQREAEAQTFYLQAIFCILLAKFVTEPRR